MQRRNLLSRVTDETSVSKCAGPIWVVVDGRILCVVASPLLTSTPRQNRIQNGQELSCVQAICSSCSRSRPRRSRLRRDVRRRVGKRSHFGCCASNRPAPELRRNRHIDDSRRRHLCLAGGSCSIRQSSQKMHFCQYSLQRR